MGLYSLMIDNLFKKIESQKEEVPFFLFFFFKKIKTLLARHTITKKRKKRHPRGDFHFSGQESRGAIHVSNIFRAKNKQAASISRSQPRGSSVKFRAAKFRSFHWHLRRVHTRRVHTYISVEHREPTVVLFRSLRDSRHPLDANSLTEPREEEEEGDYASRETIRVSRGYRRVIFSDLWNPVTGWRWREKSIEKSRRRIDERILERRILNSLKEGISFLFLFLFIRSNEALSNNNRSRDKILLKKDVFWIWNNWVFLFQRKARK